MDCLKAFPSGGPRSSYGFRDCRLADIGSLAAARMQLRRIGGHKGTLTVLAVLGVAFLLLKSLLLRRPAMEQFPIP